MLNFKVKTIFLIVGTSLFLIGLIVMIIGYSISPDVASLFTASADKASYYKQLKKAADCTFSGQIIQALGFFLTVISATLKSDFKLNINKQVGPH